MTEEFLFYIWQYRLFNSPQLLLSSGEEMSIINTGEKNTNAGPDFFNARIKIGDTVWAGNIEIHVNASDWHSHKHSSDKAYDNIILHVVFNNDRALSDKKENIVPTLELKNLIDKNKYSYYQYLKGAKTKIPCEKNFKDVHSLTVTSWLERILLERLEKKTNTIIRNLNKTTNNWEEIFYIFLSRSLGFGINAEPMELLAKSLPLAIINKHKNNLTHIEALLFGQSGLLEKDTNDAYLAELKKEYDFLKHKFSLTPIESHLWKFLRLRPANFPTVRIAQLSSILSKQSNLFSAIIDCKNPADVISLFETNTSVYWNTHYNFGKSSSKKIKTLGKSGIYQVIINTVVPLVFIYGKQRGDEALCDKALQWLWECPAEKNSITNYWKTIGAECKNAWHSQAYLELKKEYCDKKSCLNCSIGNNLLKNQ